MLNHQEREVALKQMDNLVDAFYANAIHIHNHAFIEFAGLMRAYVNSCQVAHDQGIDFSECNRHSGTPLPMESFEISYLNEKLNCIFDGRIIAVQEPVMPYQGEMAFNGIDSNDLNQAPCR